MTATAIGTLRLTGAAADTPALRLRAARELAGADLSPPGLPPAAVLVVRRLVDPLPRRLAGSTARSRPDPAWERAVRASLADAARSAVRTDGRGALPGGAAAVLFADPAEALACALRERLRGRLDGCWWWRPVRRRLELPAGIALHGRSGGRDPAPLLAARPREAPAALAWLERWGETAAVAEALSPAGAARVLAALAAVHGLPRELVTPAGPVAVVRRYREERERGVAEGREREDGGRGDAVVRRTAGGPPPEPWGRWLPAVPSGAAPEVRCLLGVALALAAAPHRLRSAEAARQGRRWWRSLREAPPALAETGVPPPAGAGDRTPGGADRGERMSPAGAVPAEPERRAVASGPDALALPPRPGADRHVRADRASVRDGVADLGRPRMDDPSDRAAGTDPTARPVREAPPQSPEPRSAGDRGTREASEDDRPPDLPTGPPDPAGAREPVVVADPAESAEAADRPLPGRALETRLGGVLYLVHALADLGLPGAFERGWRLASEAGPWGTLDLVARGLLGRRFAGAADDALWDLLAGLAGWGDDEPVRPVRRGRTLPAYRVPAGWPAKLGDPLDRAFWSATRKRLRVWSAAGYLVADVPRSAAPPSTQARRELTRVAGAAQPIPRRKPAAAAPLAEPPPLPDGCPPRLRAWLAAALPAIRRRLLLALVGGGPELRQALGTPPGGRRDPVARTLAAPGRLHVTSSHVDLVVPLAAADLAVRRAGLDRDPGWLPGFGRVVYFHFEQELGARP